MDKVDWYWLSNNPAIFVTDYQKLAIERTLCIREELMKLALHPMRIEKIMEMTGTTEFCEIDFYI